MFLFHQPAFWYRPNPWQAWALQPLAWVYQHASSLQRTLRQRHAKQSPVPVISIGNLTVGGSGKTPLTALIANHFATTHKVALVVGAGATDEAAALALQCPHANIVTHTNKRHGLNQAIQQGATLVVIDDAFHRTDIIPTVNILTFGPQGVGNGLMLPAGPLREPLSHATRATCYVLQNTSLPPNLPPKPTFHLTRTLCPATLQTLAGKTLVAVAGLAHPHAFFKQLEDAKLTIKATLALPDHHAYPATTLQTIQNLCQTHHATLVCTTKDSPKLGSLPHTAIPLVLGHETDLLLQHIGQKT